MFLSIRKSLKNKTKSNVSCIGTSILYSQKLYPNQFKSITQLSINVNLKRVIQ